MKDCYEKVIPFAYPFFHPRPDSIKLPVLVRLNFKTNNAPPPVTIVITPPAEGILPDEAPDLEYQDSLLSLLYEKVNPGIVSIQVVSQLGSSQGSGFVYDTAGHVLTNYHVVEGATGLEVDFPSGVKVYGEVVGTDVDFRPGRHQSRCSRRIPLSA